MPSSLWHAWPLLLQSNVKWVHLMFHHKNRSDHYVCGLLDRRGGGKDKKRPVIRTTRQKNRTTPKESRKGKENYAGLDKNYQKNGERKIQKKEQERRGEKKARRQKLKIWKHKRGRSEMCRALTGLILSCPVPSHYSFVKIDSVLSRPVLMSQHNTGFHSQNMVRDFILVIL